MSYIQNFSFLICVLPPGMNALVDTAGIYRTYEECAQIFDVASVWMNISLLFSNVLEMFSKGWNQPVSPLGVLQKARWLEASGNKACHVPAGCSQSDGSAPSHDSNPHPLLISRLLHLNTLVFHQAGCLPHQSIIHTIYSILHKASILYAFLPS